MLSSERRLCVYSICVSLSGLFQLVVFDWSSWSWQTADVTWKPSWNIPHSHGRR